MKKLSLTMNRKEYGNDYARRSPSADQMKKENARRKYIEDISKCRGSIPILELLSTYSQYTPLDLPTKVSQYTPILESST